MQLADPILDFLRPYTPELTSWISHFGQISANYDANGHYVRVSVAADRFRNDGSQLTPYPAGTPGLSDYTKVGTNRCPGSATQQASDASNPFLDDGIDCDPSLVPPGP
jgi:phospholipid/cholesterol/gamma-HCH transport system substrate-binding protein